MSSTKKRSGRKRKLPTSFLDCPSLSSVVDFPSNTINSDQKAGGVVDTPIPSDDSKDIFLDRFVKEIVKPYRSKKENTRGGTFVLGASGMQKQKTSLPADKSTQHKESLVRERIAGRNIWSDRLLLGTNQCLRLLEKCMIDGSASRTLPQMIVLARDIYPPTMLAHVPVMARRLGIPLLLLPGKASTELGAAIGVKKTSILLFIPSTEDDRDNRNVDSFINFVSKNIIPKPSV